MNSPFIPNQTYRRSDIHDQYGGSRRGGISVSARYPYIFIFSAKTGSQHGYRDEWENENVYSYTGEGQVNDMRFVRGNLAIRDHISQGKRVFLFIQEVKGFAKFEDEMELVDFDYFLGPDSMGNERVAIKFFFKRVGRSLDFQLDDPGSSYSHANSTRDAVKAPNVTEREGLVTSRVGQGAYRKSILYRWKFRCAVTSYAKHEILIASHIVPWALSTNEERLDRDNGILLSPTYDALFDRHLISFENSGRIILSNSLSQSNYHTLGVSGRERISDLSIHNFPYLQRHRELLEA
jgi:hypothetical protein